MLLAGTDGLELAGAEGVELAAEITALGELLGAIEGILLGAEDAPDDEGLATFAS